MDFDKEIEILSPLAAALKKTKDLGEKQEILLSHPRLKKMASEESLEPFLLHEHDLSARIALFSLVAIGQEERLFSYPKGLPPKEKIRSLLTMLVSIDRFYESIGGIAGYQLKMLQLLAKKEEKRARVTFTRASGVDLSTQTAEVEKAILAGIRAIPEMGEVYPIGGLGSRLNLLSKTGDPLPAACLPFCGRTLLEGLIRDAQAREFLYYRLFHKQVTIPIAMMTSFEKRNAKRIEAICEKSDWFFRPKESFFLFSQLSVPVVSNKGEWVLRAPLEPQLQPGGHGALWRTAEEQGVFFWFRKQEIHRLLIRQINNPIAGIDHTLIALMGIGKQEHKAFGFASCERLPHAAEGVLVLKEEEGNLHLSNIEYTDFERYGIEDQPTESGYSPYPANTNILYADIKKLHPVIKKTPLPGLMVNMKNKVLSYSPEGRTSEILAGRLESMMQNISDALSGEPCPAFLTYNERKKTISATKRKFEGNLLETPEGAFYDLLFNAHSLLRECGMSLTEFSSPEDYLKEGPSHLFLYHPALGPLYSLIQQKIQKGRFAHGSELQLEIADLFLENLELDGSLLISAHNCMGHKLQGILRYSQQTGKCVLKNVRVENRGINRGATECYWRNQIKRHQALTILLEGRSEFYAEGVAFHGNQTFIVPDGERWIISHGQNKQLQIKKEPSSWEWGYSLNGDQVRIEKSF